MQLQPSTAAAGSEIRTELDPEKEFDAESNHFSDPGRKKVTPDPAITIGLTCHERGR